jgi:6-pyruvoyltetrahydropterin/6-carboxytetrahydropterin synthase
MKLRIGVRNLYFESAHYTPSSEPDNVIHGHTYFVEVEIEGKFNENTGFIEDFNLLRDRLRNVIKELDHSLLIPRKDSDLIKVEGPFKPKIKVLDYNFVTAETISMLICDEVYERFDYKYNVKVKVYEGPDVYAEAQCP